MNPSQRESISPVKQALLALEQMSAKVAALEQARQEPIAVVGLACRFPGAPDAESYWRLLREGRDAISDVPRSRWDSDALYDADPDAPGRLSTRWGGFLDQIDRFDAEFFGIAPREAASMDPQQRLLLEVAWEALEDAAQGPDRLTSSRTGVFVGITGDEYAQLFQKSGDSAKFDMYFASGVARSVAAGRIAYVLGVQGPNMAIDTACSSSLVALHTACLHLRANECRMALAGGANVILSPEITMAFSRAHMMAADGRCKPFDSRADGFVRAEGCGVVVLKRLSDAIADGDRVLAVIRGSAINQDGRSSGLTAPSGAAQEAVVRDALKKGGLSADQIDYIEAHGTGTSLGDPIEAHALREVFGRTRNAATPLVVGSVKANMGHLESAAGIAGFIKVVLSLQREWIPAQLHYQTPNPHIDWDAMPVEIPVAGRDWRRGPRRRLAGVSAFGFSGTNAHVVVEEAPIAAQAEQAVDPRVDVLTLSARTETALAALASRHAAHLRANPDLTLADACFTSRVGRTLLAQRSAIVAGSTAELIEKLDALAEGRTGPAIVRVAPSERGRVKVCFLFTGQGAQYAQMGRELYDAEPVFRSAIDECEQLLATELDCPLTTLLWGSASDRLNETQYTQPALFAVEWALAQLWRSRGVEPAVVLGHSVGEYVAACVAGVYPLAEGLRLIAARGRLMGALPRDAGAMAAVLAPVADVRAAVAEMGGVVDVAAVNGAANVVVAGARDDVEAIAARFEGRGCRVERLRVSHAFHSPLMAPIESAFEAEAARVSMAAPRCTLVSSVTGAVATATEITKADYWRRQVRGAVQFHEALKTAAAQGCTVWIEIGPGSTLLGLAREIASDGQCLVPSLRKSKQEPALMLESLAALWARGVAVKWTIDGGRRAALPTYPFERQRHWVEFNPAGACRFDAAQHPLLGERVEIAGSHGSVIWRQELSIASVPWLADHRVHDTCILPLTAYLEALVSAAAQSTDAANGVSVADVTIEQALVVPDDRAIAMQIIATPDRLEIYSRAAADWKRHVSARPAAAPPSSRLDLPELRARIAVDRNVAEFYADLDRRGHDFGATFRGVTRLTSTPGEALARVELPSSATVDRRYRMHPALLDACVQSLAAALQVDAEASYLPIAVGRFTSYASSPAGPLWVHATVPSAVAGDIVKATIRVGNEDGLIVAELVDLELRQTTSASLARAANDDSLFFELAWEPVAPPQSLFDRDPVELASAAHSKAAALMVEHRLDRYPLLRTRVEAICAAGIMRALATLGSTTGRFNASHFAERAGVLDAQRPLFRRMLAIAGEAGALRRVGPDEWEHAAGPTLVADAWMTLRAEYPEYDAELTLSERCVPHLAAVLTGAANSLQLLFPSGSTDAAERLYAGTPSAQVFNRMLADAVRTAIASSAGPVRILEIGGGTGGSTTHVVPTLPADRVTYTFTDLSPFFVARAREKFAGTPFMRFLPLDIERDPALQQVEAGQHDIVIAANVLHATADLRQTLRHVRSTLAPGGLLVLLEMTNKEWWIDLTFGMTDGWWRFQDRDLRPDYPLITAAQWSAVLCQEGFESVGTAHAGAPSINTLVLARAAVSHSSRRDHVLIVAGDGASGPRIEAELSRMGLTSTVLHAVDDLAAAVASGGWKTIVHAAALDAPQGLALEASTLDEVQRNICGSLLDVVRGASSVSGPSVPALFVLSAGANAVKAGERVHPAQAPVWGLTRTIAHEHPRLRPVAIDLDPEAPESLGYALAAAFSASDGESQVAWRSGVQFAARLRTALSVVPPATRLRLVVPEKGQLDNLQIVPAERRRPQPGQVEVEVDLAGLSFRDVLNVLGMYPGDAGPQGGECFGRVAAIGEGVEGFAIGDEVLALASGSHDGYVLADARLVAAKPHGLSPEDALSLPISFITAAYTLEHLAGMRSGQRVLIHAGAGGVGMAAIQLALRAGAEVFATAGTPEKRAMLSALGVAHVFDSRTTDFARQILQITGGRGVDIVLNSLAGDFVDASFAAIAQGGTFLEIGKSGIWTPERVEALGRNLSYFIVDWTEEIRERPSLVGDMLRRILEETASGQLRPLPTTVFRMSDAVNAYRHMSQARHTGRILLRQNASVPIVRQGGAYLITGGTGGLGIAVARWLADAGAGALVLVSRNGGSTEARREIADLESRGVLVVTPRADVSDLAQMEAVLASLPAAARPLRGIVHAAGLLADGVMAQQDWERFHRVLAPKVEGAWNLHCVTLQERLDFFVMFSSVASVLGGAGQGNHAAANAFEDALAHARRFAGLPGISINWGAWSGVGSAVRDDLEKRRRQLGLDDLSPDEGLALLETILRAAPAQIGAARMHWSRFADQWSAAGRPKWLAGLGSRQKPRSAESARTAAPRASWRDELARVPEGNRRRAIEQHVHALAVMILGFDVNRRIDARQPLNELGLDSLMAVEFRNALASSVERSLPATLLFSYPAIEDLVAYVETLTQGRSDAAAPAATPVTGTSGVLDSIAEMSDEDVDRLLAEKLGARS